MIPLQTGTTRATIALQGAEIMEWSVGGASFLWRPNPAVWSETAPLLFPVVGWTKDHQVRVGGAVYPLGLHGFARYREFQVAEQSLDHVRLILSSDAATRALYPFDFTLGVDYRLSEGSISATLSVENCGDGAMPYACGLHPGFRWPFAGGKAEDYVIRFAAKEDPLVPVIVPGGVISQNKRRLPLDDRTLRLTPALFEDDALCFLHARSTSVRFEAPNGAAIVVETEGFPHFGFWCRPGNGYLCIEEWTGYSDPENFVGDLFAKPSMLILPPGGVGRHATRFIHEDRTLRR